MSPINIIRAWKDSEYRLSLSEAERPVAIAFYPVRINVNKVQRTLSMTLHRIWSRILPLISTSILLASWTVSAAQVGDSAVGARWCGDPHEPGLEPTENHAGGYLYESTYVCK